VTVYFLNKKSFKIYVETCFFCKINSKDRFKTSFTTMARKYITIIEFTKAGTNDNKLKH